MSVWIEVAVAVAMIGVSGALIVSHWQEGKRLGLSEPKESDTLQQDWRYRRARVRRRMQSSSLIGLVGLILLADALLQQMGAAPIWKIAVITVGIVLTLWLGMLAFADILATQRHFGQLRQQLLLEEARFLAELRHAKGKSGNHSGSSSGNGKAPRQNRTKTSP